MVLCTDLSESTDPQVFGPSHWKALENIVEHIPCSKCKDEAKKFLSFWHDKKNKELGKKLNDPSNYESELNKLQKYKLSTPTIILGITLLTLAVLFIYKNKNLKT